MNLYEPQTHSFIIKIWLEEIDDQTNEVTWRGHITHVPSGERRYIQELNAISTFIAPYLDGMGVKLGGWWRVRRWLKRFRV